MIMFNDFFPPQAGAMDRAAKLAKIQDADSESALGSVWGVSGPGTFFFLMLDVISV